ncbi:MAG: DUF418 domain-containing protein [Saprospiraceae bacterium]
MEANQLSPSLAPVSEGNRLNVIDALRGVALLGILLMNIPGFSMPNYSYEVFKNDPGSVNFWVYAVISILFEGKMRAMFGMVFGAGVLLFIANKGTLGKSVHSLFYRRMFWLIIFGLIHAHLILWIGDILYLYGVCGMILYLFRNVAPKYLILGIPLVAIMDFVGGTIFYKDIRQKRLDYTDAIKAQSAQQTLTDAQTKALTVWREVEQTMIPNREDAKENTKKMKSDYATVASYLRPMAFEGQTKYLLYSLWDSLALMLLGLALFKWGFITGSWTNAQYWKVLKLGYGIGLPLVLYNFYYNFQNYSTLEANLARLEVVPIEWTGLIYPFQRILLVLGHTASIILIYKAGFFKNLFRRLESVGRMAFTNYISHSIICTLFFFGYGLNYFGELQYYQIFYVALAIWLLQLIISPLWLRYYYFGPLEWLWRSLTYWKMPEFKRKHV